MQSFFKTSKFIFPLLQSKQTKANSEDDVMVIVVGNGHGNTSSNPGRD